VASVITGASTVEQVRNNAKAARSKTLSNDELLLIKELTKSSIYKEHRY
jgi:aryl-alcohol dehydrogenase-like predicted oxidoreductase